MVSAIEVKRLSVGFNVTVGMFKTTLIKNGGKMKISTTNNFDLI